MAESLPAYRPRNAVILMVLYGLLFAGFIYLLLARPDVLAAEDLPLTENTELHLLGANCGILYAAVLLITPAFVALAYVSTSDPPAKSGS